MYRYHATSLEGFVQQLAVSYLRHGYWFYVTGRVPAGKDPLAVDAKLIRTYDIAKTKWARAWAKSLGKANMQYIRHESFFVLLATHGQHVFFEREKDLIRDAREVPIRHGGYAVSYRGGHPHVRIEHGEYLMLRAWFELEGTKRDSASLGRALRQLPFEPYGPVKRQLFNVLRGLNRVRKTAGLEMIGNEWLRLNRRIVQPFAPAILQDHPLIEEAVTPPIVSAASTRLGQQTEIPPATALTLTDRGMFNSPDDHPEPSDDRQTFPDFEPWMEDVLRDSDDGAGVGPPDNPTPPQPPLPRRGK